MIVDLFAGGGGASLGIQWALGWTGRRCIDCRRWVWGGPTRCVACVRHSQAKPPEPAPSEPQEDEDEQAARCAAYGCYCGYGCPPHAGCRGGNEPCPVCTPPTELSTALAERDAAQEKGEDNG